MALTVPDYGGEDPKPQPDPIPEPQPAPPKPAVASLFERPEPAAKESVVSRLFAGDSDAERLRVAFRMGMGKDPERAARIVRVGLKTGLPNDLIDEHLDEFEAEAKLSNFNAAEFRQRSPVVARWIKQNADQGAAVSDDMDRLAAIEEIVRFRRPATMRADPGTADYIEIARQDAIRKGSLIDYVRTLPVLRNIFGIVGGVEQGANDIAGGIAYGMELSGVEGASQIGHELDRRNEDIGIQRSQMASSSVERGFNSVTGGVSRVVTNLIVPGGVVKGLRYIGLAPRLAGYLGQGTWAGLQGAQQADIAAEDAGLVGWEKAAFVLEHAATEAGFTMLFGLHGAEAVGQPLEQIVTNTFRRYLGYAGHAGGEALEENATNLTHDFIDWMQLPQNANVTIGQAFNQWLASVPETTAVAGIVGGGTHLVRDFRMMPAIRQAQQDEQFFKALGEGVKDSKTFQRLPEGVQRIVEAVTKGGPVENVYAPLEEWNEYWQSKKADPRAIAEQVMGSPAAYDQAVRDGTDLVIPTHAYATKIAPSEHNTYFQEVLKLDPEGMNAKEAKTLFDETEKAAKKGELSPEAKAADDHEAAVTLLTEQISQKLIAAGQKPRDVPADAALYARGIAAMAQRNGLDPLELAQQFQLDVEARMDGETPASAAAQAAYQQPTIKRGNYSIYPFQEAAEKRFAERLAQPDAMEAYAKLEGTRGGKVLNVDDMRFMSEDFAKDKIGATLHTLSTHGPASAKVKAEYRARLAKPATGSVVFLAGGGGSGKGTVSRGMLSKIIDESDVTLDGTFSNTAKARQFIEDALDSGRPVIVPYIHRHMLDAAKGAVDRFKDSGRYVPPEVLVEAHIGAQETIIALAEEYADHPAVRIQLIDNTTREAREISVGDLKAKRYIQTGESEQDAIARYLPSVREVTKDVDREIHEALEGAQADFARASGEERSPSQGDHEGRHPGPERDPESPGQHGGGPEVTFNQDVAPRGSIRFVGNKAIIALGEARDRSTFLHETGHFYLELLRNLATREGAAEQTKADMQILHDWFGTDKIATPQHEQFARGFERYLMEGKAPSIELRGVFGRFARWLARIYKHLRGLDVTLSDEVRGVMDRLLATDEEIAAAQAEASIQPIFATAEDAKMTASEFAAYSGKVEKASLAAREKVERQLFAELQREQKEEYLAEREKIQDEVEAEMATRRGYNSLAVLRSTSKSTALKIATDDLAAYGKQTGNKDAVKALTKLKVTRREGGVPLAMAAEILGYGSADEMVHEITTLPAFAGAVQQRVDELMKERHPSLMETDKIAEVAKEAVATEGRAEVVLAELKEVRRLQRDARKAASQAAAEAKAAERAKGDERVADEKLKGQVALAMAAASKDVAVGAVKEQQAQKAAAERTQRDTQVAGIPSLEDIRTHARARVFTKVLKTLKPQIHWVAARQHARAAFRAMGSKDYARAAMEKSQELVSLELYRAEVDAKKTAEKQVEALRRAGTEKARAKLGLAGKSYLDQVDALLERFTLKDLTAKEVEKRESLKEWISRQDGPVDIDPQLVDEAFRTHYTNLTVDQLDGLHDAVTNIVHLANFKNKLLKSKKYHEVEAAIADGVATIEANLPKLTPAKISGERTNLDNKASWLDSALAAHRKLSSFVRQMDGGEAGGVMWNLLVRPLNEAGDAEVDARAAAGKEQKALWNTWGKDGRKIADKVHIPAIGMSLNYESRIMVALNWGNAGNRERLKAGETWNDAQVMAVIDTLDKTDMALVQGILDHVDSFWPEIEAKQRRVTGLAPEKIEAEIIHTKHGNYRGGYFPIKYDPARSTRASDQAAIGEAHLYEMGAATRATTRRGHTEARSDGAGRALKLDLSVLDQHILQVIHDLTHHEVLLDINRLVGDQRMADAIQNHLGPAARQQIKGILGDIAAGDLGFDAVASSLRWARNGVSTAVLGFRPVTAMMQLTGVTQSAQLVGVRPMLRAIGQVFGNPMRTGSAMKFVQGKSRFMANRSTTAIREVGEVLGQLRGGKWKDNLARYSHYMTLKAQQAVDTPTWLAAYENALNDGKEDADAVAIADQAVIDTQGSGMTKDLAGVQRSKVTQLFTVFYSYGSTLFSRTAEALGEARRKWRGGQKPEAVAKLTGDLILLYLMPAVMTAIVRDLVKADDEDDDSTFKGNVARELLSTTLGTVIGLRELTGAFQGYGYEGPAGAMGFNAISDLIVQAKQGELDAGLVAAAARVVGIWGHLPAGQAVSTIEGLMYLLEHPSADVRPLLFGPTTAQKRE